MRDPSAFAAHRGQRFRHRQRPFGIVNPDHVVICIGRIGHGDQDTEKRRPLHPRCRTLSKWRNRWWRGETERRCRFLHQSLFQMDDRRLQIKAQRRIMSDEPETLDAERLLCFATGIFTLYDDKGQFVETR